MMKKWGYHGVCSVFVNRLLETNPPSQNTTSGSPGGNSFFFFYSSLALSEASSPPRLFLREPLPFLALPLEPLPRRASGTSLRTSPSSRSRPMSWRRATARRHRDRGTSAAVVTTAPDAVRCQTMDGSASSAERRCTQMPTSASLVRPGRVSLPSAAIGEKVMCEAPAARWMPLEA